MRCHRMRGTCLSVTRCIRLDLRTAVRDHCLGTSIGSFCKMPLKMYLNMLYIGTTLLSGCFSSALSIIRANHTIAVYLFFRMAAEYSLYPLYKEEFHHVFSENQDHQEFGPLMVRMKVVDVNGESSMDEDQWEAASSSCHLWHYSGPLIHLN